MASFFKRKPDGPWWAAYFDHAGRRRYCSTGTTDRRDAGRIVAKWESEAALRREGVVNQEHERLSAASARPLKEHVEEFVTHRERAGRSSAHVEDVETVLNAFMRRMSVGRLSDLDQGSIEAYLERRRSEDKNGARTLNRVRAVFSAFARWGMKTGRLASNPVSSIPEQNEAADVRVKRRALADEELAKLFEVADERGRGLWYRCAYYLGLRRSELRRLPWSAIDFDAGTVTIDFGKAKRADVLPLHPELRPYPAAVRPTLVTPVARVFPRVVSHEARRADFTRAGIATENAAGERADLHSLRVSFATGLARGGVAPQVAMRLLRHATFGTTAKHYVRLDLDDMEGAIGKVGAPASRPQRMALAAGGEHDVNSGRANTGANTQGTKRCDSVRDGASSELAEVGAFPGENGQNPGNARMAELADALDLGSSG